MILKLVLCTAVKSPPKVTVNVVRFTHVHSKSVPRSTAVAGVKISRQSLEEPPAASVAFASISRSRLAVIPTKPSRQMAVRNATADALVQAARSAPPSKSASLIRHDGGRYPGAQMLQAAPAQTPPSAVVLLHAHEPAVLHVPCPLHVSSAVHRMQLGPK
jgi:hypothetical protein